MKMMMNNLKKRWQIKRKIKELSSLAVNINDNIQACLEMGDIQSRLSLEISLRDTVNEWLTLEESLVTGKYKEDM